MVEQRAVAVSGETGCAGLRGIGGLTPGSQVGGEELRRGGVREGSEDGCRDDNAAGLEPLEVLGGDGGGVEIERGEQAGSHRLGERFERGAGAEVGGAIFEDPQRGGDGSQGQAGDAEEGEGDLAPNGGGGAHAVGPPMRRRAFSRSPGVGCSPCALSVVGLSR